jgi:hypothetical protein
MNLINKIRDWGDHHHPKWLDYFRIVLGMILVWKGIQFAINLHAFTELMKELRYSNIHQSVCPCHYCVSPYWRYVDCGWFQYARMLHAQPDHTCWSGVLRQHA